MQGVTVELGPRQVDLVLKSIEIVRRTLMDLEDEADRNIETTEELLRIAEILGRAKEKYDRTARDVQLVLY
ncbi:MAG: hypothetical protein ACRD6B_14295 [Bryobacteraceae bacterium]